jgi:hypothetical protein
MSVEDAFQCARSLQTLQQQKNLAPILVAAMRIGGNLASFQQRGWESTARELIAPPATWQDINFYLIMKCIDAVKASAEDCKAARDLRLTEKRIEEDTAFLVNEEKKAEIRSGFIQKKLAKVSDAGDANAVDLKQLELQAEAKVAEVLRAKQVAIDKNRNSLPQKNEILEASMEFKLWVCVKSVWFSCGAYAIHDEFQTLDRCASIL